MGKILTVRKTITTQAIQINSPEEEAVVQGWLSAMGVGDHTGVAQLKEQKFWFLLDEGSEIVYVSPPDDFEKNFEELSAVTFTEQTAPESGVQVAPYRSDFTF